MPAPARAPLKRLDDALAQLLAAVTPLVETAQVATMLADGRVLASDIRSELQVPAWDNSAMDGYALRAADVTAPGTELPVSQRIAAGSHGAPLAAATVARIFTGAPVPAGADTVVMQEDCEALVPTEPFTAAKATVGDVETEKSVGRAQGNAGLEANASRPSPILRVRVLSVPKIGQHIRRAGEDVTHGALVLSKGCRLGPAELGLAASIGVAHLQVVQRPRVALFSTGDELVMPGDRAPADMPPGAIYNSNRFFLNALLRRLGCEVTDMGIVPDQREATVAALREAAKSHDVILTSGGVSVGEEDHIKPAVQTLGSLDLWQIAMKPGKPFAHGRIGTAHFIGLPGNPVSSFVTFLLLVRPFLLRLQGALQTELPTQHLQANFAWPKADKRREFLRVRRNDSGGLDLFSNQSSGVLTSAVWGEGLVDNPSGQTIAPGDLVSFLSFAELLA